MVYLSKMISSSAASYSVRGGSGGCGNVGVSGSTHSMQSLLNLQEHGEHSHHHHHASPRVQVAKKIMQNKQQNHSSSISRCAKRVRQIPLRQQKP